MPYLLVSTLVRLEIGPTIVGDEQSDPDLMTKIGAVLGQQKGCPFKEYTVSDPPRIVLNKLEKLGYSVINTSGIGQTIVWTLHKPISE
ncbi:GTP cyclohydrolase 1 feedback regulatory protein-like [Styela clava]